MIFLDRVHRQVLNVLSAKPQVAVDYESVEVVYATQAEAMRKGRKQAKAAKAKSVSASQVTAPVAVAAPTKPDT